MANFSFEDWIGEKGGNLDARRGTPEGAPCDSGGNLPPPGA